MFLCCIESCVVALQNIDSGRTQNNSTEEQQATVKTTETQSLNHIDTTNQQPGNDKPSEQCSEKKLCNWVMAKATSFNEVNSHDFDTLGDVTYARVSLDAESGPAANRRRRKRYSPSRNNPQKVSMNKFF